MNDRERRQERLDRLAAAAGATPLERELLNVAVMRVGPPPTANPGQNNTRLVVLATREEAYFKGFSAQSATLAKAFAQHPHEVPLHEVIAWRLAHAMGAPWDAMVPTAVLRVVNGEGGALVASVPGQPAYESAWSLARSRCMRAAVWDALVGQQDRHALQLRFDTRGRRLSLIDHGFAFARPGDPGAASQFLADRRRLPGGATLSNAEIEALEGVVASGDLFGIRDFLPEDRADALEARAKTMAETKLLPLPGGF